MGLARFFKAVVTLIAGAVLSVSASQAADLSAQGPAMRDPIAPTVPRGFAADLPRSPLVDGIVDGRYRFETRVEAQRRCPDDDVVVVEPFTTTYRLAPASGPGPFMCKAAALQEGDLPR